MSLISIAALNTAPPLNTQSTGRDSASTLNSQHSSFDDSPGSQYLVSQTFNESNLRSSQQNGQGASTPATSLSNPSSQDDLGSRPRKIENVAAVSRSGFNILGGGGMPSSDNYYSEASAHEGPAMTHRPTAAKRTADGHLKPLLPAVLDDGSEHRHSRTSSTASRSSQISELSHQLKTRLSYAMVKVQNGWQDCNIDELETMASQPCSPVSAAAPLQRSRKSSHSLILSPGPVRSVLNGSPVQGDGIPGAATRHALLSGLPHSHPSPASKLQILQETMQPPRTYESFWKERSAHRSHPRSPAQAPYRHQPSLAPPADIKSHEAFSSSGLNASGQPRVHGKSRSLGSPFKHPSNNNDTAYTVPITPPPLSSMKPPPMRTPSQNAAMEADAVETLLFMSSPENAHPRSAAAHIPSSRLPTDWPRIYHDNNQQQRSSLAPANGNGIPTYPKARLQATTSDQNSPRKKRDTRDIDEILDDVVSSSDGDDDDDLSPGAR